MKTVAAYRTGFAPDPARPADAEVTGAARRWLTAGGRLTDWLHLTAGTIPVLLHCWPHQSQAAYLAAVFEHVYLDVGLSSDAYGPAEFHLLGAVSFRHGLGALLQHRVDADELSPPDAQRLVRWTGSANARRLYGLPSETVPRRD